MEKVDCVGYKQNWVMDPKGYFLIRVSGSSLEVGHCIDKPKPITVFTGSTPEEVLYKVIDSGLISRMDHAGYLGKELQKAYFSVLLKKKYVQDSRLDL